MRAVGPVFPRCNAFVGPVRNPCDPSAIAGGSIGRTAAAIAARIGATGLGRAGPAQVQVAWNLLI
ncbi:MAG: hypothetical protein HY215_09025 [Candidatus Rokubacteria bacterium]|nr:hypothetical protein [Candidatus Rokubacteria bacterium]